MEKIDKKIPKPTKGLTLSPSPFFVLDILLELYSTQATWKIACALLDNDLYT